MFTFLSNNLNNELNNILAGYFSKVLISLLKAKSNQLLRYICIKKTDNLLGLLNRVGNKSICDFIIKILLYEPQHSLEESANFDIVKLNILNKLITCTSRDEILNIQDLILEFFENTKNFESVLNERFLTNLSNQFAFINSSSNCNKELLIIAKELMLHFKTEYEKAQKFMSSMSMSKIFNIIQLNFVIHLILLL